MHQVKSYAFYKQEGIQVDKIVSSVKTYLKKSSAYLSTLILVKSIKMTADGMPIKFSNKVWLEMLNNTHVRGLQHAFTRLENTILPGFDKPILSRTFADAAKRNRTEFQVDRKQLIHLLMLTEKDVKDMPRGSLEKHFYYQSGLKVRDYLKDLKKAEKLARHEKFNSDPKFQAKYNQIMESVRERQQEFDKHVQRIYNRLERSINKVIDITDELKKEARSKFFSFLSDNNYVPPEKIKN